MFRWTDNIFTLIPGVALAGAVIWYKPHWQIIDPICTFGFSVLVCLSTVPLMKKLLSILLEGTPEHVEWRDVEASLRSIPGVVDLHDLHLWNLSSQSVALTCHIRVSPLFRDFYQDAVTIFV
jgi:zinc transporter 2